MVQQLAGMSILIVEDDLLIGLDLCLTLTAAGAEVRMSEDYRGAEELIAATGEPSLAIIDILPEYGSTEDVGLRLADGRFPILVHTGRLEYDGTAPVLPKPCLPGVLIATVIDTIARHQEKAALPPAQIIPPSDEPDPRNF